MKTPYDPGREKDRIVLAEAVGWTDVRHHSNGMVSAMPPNADPKWQHHLELPDPFTDANDDYAVLEWARKQRDIPGWWSEFIEALDEADALDTLAYQIGDYARAVLAVLRSTETEKSNES